MVNNENYIALLKEKEMLALEFTIHKYSNLVFRIAYGILQNRELSDECLNSLFMKVWESIDKFNGDETKFKNWLCTIAKYTAIDMLRREKKHENNKDIDGMEIATNLNIEDNFEVENNLQIIKYTINSMSTQDREIFIRRFYKDERIKDIATSLGLTENAVTLRILRGRKKLYSALEKGDGHNER